MTPLSLLPAHGGLQLNGAPITPGAPLYPGQPLAAPTLPLQPPAPAPAPAYNPTPPAVTPPAFPTQSNATRNKDSGYPFPSEDDRKRSQVDQKKSYQEELKRQVPVM